jgi:pimeloyl-[acyl-carrier protein] methyl ester esterase
MTSSFRPLARLTVILLACLALALGGAASAQERSFEPARFTIEVSGEGPDVIFIPGLATSRGVWADAVQALGPFLGE